MASGAPPIPSREGHRLSRTLALAQCLFLILLLFLVIIAILRGSYRIPLMKDNRALNSPLGPLCACLVSIAALLLVACGETVALCSGPDGRPIQCVSGYICPNGTAVTGEATADNIVRCQSCNSTATLNGTPGAIGTSCQLAAIGGAVRRGNAIRFNVNEREPTGLAAIGDTLYMVGFTNEALYTLDISSGRANRVGLITQFDESESQPTGLAAIGNTLYMVGWDRARLFTINIDPSDGTADDGKATQVGRQTSGFGVSETQPTGLAAIGNTLYMVGWDSARLYTINIDPSDGTTDDGMATQVGTLGRGFEVSEFQPTGLAAIGNTLYMVGQSNDVLYTLNTSTGKATPVGSAAAGFGVNEESPFDLAVLGTGLYMVGGDADAIFTLRYQ